MRLEKKRAVEPNAYKPASARECKGWCGLTGHSHVRQTHVMKMPTLHSRCKATSLVFLLAAGALWPARAEWQRTETSLAWRTGTNALWEFSFDPKKGKPFFHPLTANGRALTNFKPEDHPWHYGFWFSWKYINHVNYWEENRQTGKGEGATRWETPVIETKPDGSAAIKLNLSYTNPTGRVDMVEVRELKISAPTPAGDYSIDWRAHFTAGKAGAVLDRTAMPGEPGGAVNGGYAGLGLRMAAPPLGFSVLCSTGAVSRFQSDRARPFAPALACNFTEGDRDIGGVAIFSDPINAGVESPWYVVNAKEMRFACSAILAPKIRTLQPDEKMELRYRIAIRSKPWTVEDLKAK